MKVPFLPRFYFAIAILVAVVAFAPPDAKAIAVLLLTGLLVVSGTISCLAAFYAFAQSSCLAAYDIARFEKSVYIDHAVVGFVMMALGYTGLAWGWIAIAGVRAAVILWASANRRA